MKRQRTSVATPVAHLVGPGKVKVVNGRLAFSGSHDGAVRLDPEALETVLCYGKVTLTDEALRVLFAHDIPVACLSAAGHRCRGRLVGADASTAGLRVLQYRAQSDPRARLEIARQVVDEKIASQRKAARHHQRHRVVAAGPARKALDQLHKARRRCGAAESLEALRGVEGTASRAWFTLFGHLLRPPWQFTDRVRRPPTDPVNALLSLGYTLLTSRLVARCEAAGLEVALGALHDYRPGRPSLACDLVEPLRVDVVDRWVVSLCNGKKVRPKDFLTGEDGGVRLKPASFGRVLGAWESSWQHRGCGRWLDHAVQRTTERLRSIADGTGLEGEAVGGADETES